MSPLNKECPLVIITDTKLAAVYWCSHCGCIYEEDRDFSKKIAPRFPELTTCEYLLDF